MSILSSYIKTNAILITGIQLPTSTYSHSRNSLSSPSHRGLEEAELVKQVFV